LYASAWLGRGCTFPAFNEEIHEGTLAACTEAESLVGHLESISRIEGRIAELLAHVRRGAGRDDRETLRFSDRQRAERHTADERKDCTA